MIFWVIFVLLSLSLFMILIMYIIKLDKRESEKYKAIAEQRGWNYAYKGSKEFISSLKPSILNYKPKLILTAKNIIYKDNKAVFTLFLRINEDNTQTYKTYINRTNLPDFAIIPKTGKWQFSIADELIKNYKFNEFPTYLHHHRLLINTQSLPSDFVTELSDLLNAREISDYYIGSTGGLFMIARKVKVTKVEESEFYFDMFKAIEEIIFLVFGKLQSS